MFLSLIWWEGAARNKGEAVSIEKLSAVTSWNCRGEHKKLTVKSDAFSYKGQLLLVSPTLQGHCGGWQVDGIGSWLVLVEAGSATWCYTTLSIFYVFENFPNSQLKYSSSCFDVKVTETWACESALGPHPHCTSS